MKAIKEENEQNYIEKMQRREESEAQLRDAKMRNIQEKAEAAQRRSEMKNLVYESKRSQMQETRRQRTEGLQSLARDKVLDMADKMVVNR